MIVAIAITVVPTVIAATVNSDGGITAAVIARPVIAVTRVVVSAARLDDGRRFRTVIRIAPGAASNIGRVVVTTRKRQGCCDSQ